MKLGWLEKLFDFNYLFNFNRKKEIIALPEAEDWINNKTQDFYKKYKLNEKSEEFVSILFQKKVRMEQLLINCNVSKKFNLEDSLSKLTSVLKLLDSNLDQELSVVWKTCCVIENSLKEVLIDVVAVIDNNSDDGIEGGLNNCPTNLVELSQEINSLLSVIDDFSKLIKSDKLDSLNKLKEIVSNLKDILVSEKEFEQSYNHNLDRLAKIKNQKEEKEINLLKVKDSPRFRQLGDLESNKNDVKTRLDNIEDDMFSALSNLKKSLNILQDFNSDHGLLDTIKVVNSLQENLDEAFNKQSYNALLFRLKDVENKINSGDLLEKEDDYNFLTVLSEFESNEVKMLLEQYCILQEKILLIPKVGLRHEILTKVDDIKYRLEHFNNQEEVLNKKVSEIQERLDEFLDQKIKMKQLFENLVKVSFSKQIELALLQELCVDEQNPITS